MEKNNILKSSVISGTLILTFTGIISRFIGFYYKIFLSRAIGAEGLGIYQLIFPIFALFLAVTSSGIQTAISRSCASCQSERQARGFLLAGISMTLTLSLLSMLLIHTKADWFCRNMMEGINGTSLLYIMLWAIPFAGVHSCINGYYYGRKKAAIPAFSQLFEQMIRVLGVWLLMQIALEQGRTPSASDAVWGILIGEVGSACYCITALSLSSFRTKTKEYAASGHSSDIFIEKNKPSSATHQRKPKLPIRKCLYKKEYSYKKRKDSIFLRKTHCLYGKSTKIYVPCPYR